MRTNLVTPAISFAVVLLYLAGVQVGRGMQAPEADGLEVSMALPSPRNAKIAAVGFDTLAADLYFIKAVQYYGDVRTSYADHYKHLPLLLDVVTELDPHWDLPVRWGAVAMQRNLGNETWLNIPESTRLLRKGVERFPDDWRMHVYLAYNLSTFHGEYGEAAQMVERAARLGTGPSYLPSLATRLYSTAGDLQTAAAFAGAMAEGAEDPQIQELMRERQLDVQTEGILRDLDQAIFDYHARHDRWPTRVDELIMGELLDALPAEPRGGAWFIDQGSHTARTTAMKTRLLIHLPNKSYEQLLPQRTGPQDERHARPASPASTP